MAATYYGFYDPDALKYTKAVFVYMDAADENEVRCTVVSTNPSVTNISHGPETVSLGQLGRFVRKETVGYDREIYPDA